MQHLTLSEIARAAGVGKATVKRAIDDGRLSVAMRNARGQHLIDPAEVLRVWPAADLDRRHTRSTVPPEPAGTNGTPVVEELRQALERAEAALAAANRDLAHERAERTAERERLDAERSRLIRMVEETLPRLLTDQRVEQTERPRPWWKRLLGGG